MSTLLGWYIHFINQEQESGIEIGKVYYNRQIDIGKMYRKV